jgi:ketosteroid isomerase-like protein
MKKKKVAMSPADKDAIKLKFKRWKTLCCAYNARNPDEILYYADDAISFLTKNPLEGKVAIHESIKKICNIPKSSENIVRDQRSSYFK